MNKELTQAESKNLRLSFTKYISALILFGSNGVVASFINLPSYQIIMLRLGLGFAIIGSIALIKNSLKGIIKNRKDIFFVALSGVFMGISFLFQYEAYDRIGISLTCIIYCLGPIFIVIVSQFIFRESMNLKKVMCLTAVTFGAIFTGGLSIEKGADALGIICAVACALSYAGMIISNKKNKSVQGFSNTTIQLFSAFITVLIYNLIRQAVSGSFNLNISRSDILPILLLGVLNTGIGCYLYFVGIIKIPAQTVAVCDYLEPMTGIFFSALILHETIGPEKIIGAVLILSGTFFWNVNLQQLHLIKPIKIIHVKTNKQYYVGKQKVHKE